MIRATKDAVTRPEYASNPAWLNPARIEMSTALKRERATGGLVSLSDQKRPDNSRCRGLTRGQALNDAGEAWVLA